MTCPSRAMRRQTRKKKEEATPQAERDMIYPRDFLISVMPWSACCIARGSSSSHASRRQVPVHRSCQARRAFLCLVRPHVSSSLAGGACTSTYRYPTNSPTHNGLNATTNYRSSQEETRMLSSHIPPLPAQQSASSLERLCHIPTGSVASSFDWETWMSLRRQGIAQCPHPAAKMRYDQPST